MVSDKDQMVVSKIRFVLGTVALLVGAAIPLFSQTSATKFIAACRLPSEAWLLDDTGRVYRQLGSSAPVPQFSLEQKDGSPYRWRRSPSGIARFKDLWVVVDGSKMLRTFSSAGTLVAEVELPVPSFDVIATKSRCWIYYSLPEPVPHALWSTADLRSFTPSAFEPTDPKLSRRDRMLAAHLVFALGQDDVFYFGHGIGEPSVTKIGAGASRTVIPLAYLRSRTRAALLLPSDAPDVESYSAPMRDLLALANGELAVLRNREDIKTGNGVVVSQQGRRIDRYGADGRQLSTATFPLTVRWILHAGKDQVWALAPDGTVHAAPFGPPIRGGIVD